MHDLAPLPPTDQALVVALFGDGSEAPHERIGSLIERIRAVPQVEMPVEHYFAPYLYVRKILVPKGTVAIGKIHRHPHLGAMLNGDMTFLTKRGVQRIAGHCVLPLAAPYTQRAVLAHEDTVLLNFHPTTIALPCLDDLEALEAAIIAPPGEGDALEGADLIREIAKHAEADK